MNLVATFPLGAAWLKVQVFDVGAMLLKEARQVSYGVEIASHCQQMVLAHYPCEVVDQSECLAEQSAIKPIIAARA